MGAVGEQAWDEEARLAQQAIKDAGELDEDVDGFEKELVGNKQQMDAGHYKEDEEAIKKIRGAEARLKKEAQGVLDDVHNKAEHRRQKLSEKLNEASKAEKNAGNH